MTAKPRKRLFDVLVHFTRGNEKRVQHFEVERATPAGAIARAIACLRGSVREEVNRIDVNEVLRRDS